jgi:hypothetical protein
MYYEDTEHLHLANVDERDIKDNANKLIRKANYVINPDITDSDSISSETSQSGSHAQIPYLQQCKVKSRNQGT